MMITLTLTKPGSNGYKGLLAQESVYVFLDISEHISFCPINIHSVYLQREVICISCNLLTFCYNEGFSAPIFLCYESPNSFKSHNIYIDFANKLRWSSENQQPRLSIVLFTRIAFTINFLSVFHLFFLVSFSFLCQYLFPLFFFFCSRQNFFLSLNLSYSFVLIFSLPIVNKFCLILLYFFN